MKLLLVTPGIIVIAIVTRQIVAEGAFQKKRGRNGCWSVPSAKRSTVGKPPVQWYTYFFAVRITHRIIRTTHLRARTPTKNSLHPKGIVNKNHIQHLRSQSRPPTLSQRTSQKLLRYTFLALMYLVVVLPSCQLALFCHQTEMTESLFVLSITFPEGSRPNSGQEPQVLMT